MTPPDSLQHNVYCALPGSMRSRSLVSAELTNSAAPGPRTNALPRWLTSNRPTVVRGAVCSLTVPAYDTGISQPPNSAKLAPSSRWRSSSGPCKRSLLIGAAPPHRCALHRRQRGSRHSTLIRLVTGTLGQVADSFDFEALQAAGIANTRERAGLIEYLADLGFTADEMVEAERHGRLFGLAGDALLWSGPPIYTLRTAADAIGVALEDVEHGWAMLGLTVADPDTPDLRQGAVDSLATWVAMRTQMGIDAADGFLRVLGSNVARVAEAISSMIRAARPNMSLRATGAEAPTATAHPP